VSTGRQDAYIENTLRGIERRVLQEIKITRAWRIAATWAVGVLAVAAVARWWSAGAIHPVAHGGGAVLPATTAVLLLAAFLSAVALRKRRFRWCCAAVIICWVGSVTGMAALWWHRTTPAPDPLVWTVLCTVAVVVLTVTWLVVLLTPVERSQPDMRVWHTAGR
jgi:hypothetical protein